MAGYSQEERLEELGGVSTTVLFGFRDDMSIAMSESSKDLIFFLGLKETRTYMILLTF